MKKLVGLAAVLSVFGCNNFDALVERCNSEGRCGANGAGGGGGANEAPGVLSASPASLAQAAVIGDSADPQAITLENLGPGPAENVIVAREGVDAADFLLVNGCPLTLSAGQKCSVTIAFAPTAGVGGTRTARLEVRPAKGALVSVALTGTATPALEHAASLEFGDVTTMTQSTLLLTVANASKSPHQVVASSSTPFLVATNGCSTVGPGQSCSIAVRFEPASRGEAQGTLQLALQGSTTTQSVILRGRGVDPGVLQLIPATLFTGAANDFTDAGVQLARSFQVKNNGAQVIGPLDLQVANDDGGQAFRLVNIDCGFLDAGTTCNGTVTFSPNVLGAYSGRLFVDGGAVGATSSSLLAYGTALFSFSATLSHRDAGLSVTTTPAVVPVCSGQCTSLVFVSPLAVPQLTVSASRSKRLDFVTWSGACSGSGACTLALDTNRQVTAQFSPVNVAFITSSMTDGNLGGLDGGDRFCQNHARDAGLSGTFVALLGMSDAGYQARLPANRGWIRVDGETVAKDRSDFAAGRSLYVLDQDEHGAQATGVNTWTGFLFDGGVPSTCYDWTRADWSGSTLAQQGSPWDGPYSFTGVGGYQPDSDFCGNQNRLMCFQTDGQGQPALPAADGGLRMFVAYADADGGSWWFDDACAGAAQRLGYSANFLAYVDLGPGTAKNRLDAGLTGPVVRPDGVLLYASAGDLKAGAAPLNPIAFVVFPDGGTGTADVPVMLGGYPSGLNCIGGVGWTYFGYSGSRSQAFAGNTGPCTGSSAFYCLPR